MALTDPVNVQQGQQRRATLLARLAQQMRSKQGNVARAAMSPTGRVQSSGRSFGNNVDLRAGATPRFQLPFELPSGRVRPAGFDSTPDNNGVPSAPPLGGVGGVTPASASIDLSGLPQQDTSVPGGFPIDPGGFNSDTPLNTPAPAASATPGFGLDPAVAARLTSQASPVPDPYAIMMQRMNLLRQARMDAMGITP